ncbi:signal transduction histidine kinase [Galbibacter marinus]|uniref:histidine kinase n=2 Tax=Galbibacter marinus TaxID=555500 RepID=K2PSM7_9FLAO|nr:signal transduction histidine kinase [Galbibacter marinus]
MGKNMVRYQIVVLLFGIVLIVFFNRCQKTSHKSDQTYTDTEAKAAMLISKAKANHSDSTIIYLKEALGLVDHLKQDSTAGKYLEKISTQAIYLKDSVLFNTANAKAMELAVKTGDSLSMGHAHWNYGIWYLNEERFDSAYYQYDKAQHHFENQGHLYYAGKIHYNKASILCRNKHYTGAEVEVFRALKLFEPNKNYKQLYLCYNLLGIIYNELKEYENAIDAYTKGLGYLKNVKDPGLFRDHTLNNVGVLYHKSGDYQKAVSYFDKALENPGVQKTDKALYARLLDNRAYSRLKLKDTTGLYTEYNRALKIRDSLESKLGVITSKHHLAWYRAYAGDTLRAIQLAKESYQLAKSIQSNSDVLDNLELLAAIDPVNVAGYQKEQISLINKLRNHERQTRNKFMAIQYEAQKYKQQTAKLSVINNKRLNLIGFLLVLLVFLFICYRQHVRYKQLQLETAQQKADMDLYILLHKQLEKYEEGREEERLRISQELHEGLLPEFYAVRMDLEDLSLEGDAESLTRYRKCIEELKHIYKGIRGVSHTLRASRIFTSVNFTAIIVDLAKERAVTGKFKLIIDTDLNIDWSKYERLTKMDLYYYINEALQNCIVHAKATKVTLKLKIQGQSLVVIVADNGVGMSKVSSKGIGLKNMQSRIDKLKGKFTIESTQGKGTKLVMTIPYPTSNSLNPNLS